MSEEKHPETEAGAEGAAGDAKKKPAAAGPAPIVLIAVIVVALGAGAALGSLLIAPRVIHARQAAAAAQAADPHKKKKDDKKDKKKGKEGEAGKATVYKLDNIIVNPAGSQGSRFLMCSIVVQPEDDKLVDTFREHEVELRDKVVSQLAATTLDQLTAPGGRDSLRTRLVATIKSVLDKDDQETEIKVFLPQFVIQ